MYASIGRELIESLRNDTLVGDGAARDAFPIRPRGFREAIERALVNEDKEFAEARWSDALSPYRGRNWGATGNPQKPQTREPPQAASKATVDRNRGS